MTFQEAIQKMSSHEKIIYGTRTNSWEIITATDRDFLTPWAITKDQALKTSETDCLIQSTKTLFLS